MRTALYLGSGVISVDEWPDLAAGEAVGVLAVEGSGVCIADGEVMRGIGGPPHRPPIVLGHEIVGRVVAAGPDAPAKITSMIGRRVILDDARPCGKCAFCLRDAPRCCRSAHYGHISWQDGTCWGGYADSVTLDQLSNLHPIPEDLTLARATFAFPLASGIEWVHRLADLRPGETVAVVGSSRMAVASVAASTLRRAGRIVMFGENGGDAAQEAADSLGAEILVGQGDAGLAGQFDVVVVVTEASAGETALGLSLGGTLGRVITASCSTGVVAVEPESIRKRGLLVRGGRGHTAASLDDAILAVDQHREWFPEGFLETFALDDAQRALTSMHDSRNHPYGRHRVIVTGAGRGE